MTNLTSSIQVSEEELRWLVARAISIPQHHTTWDILTEREKDLFYMQAGYAIDAMRSKEQNQPVTVAAHPTLPVVVADGELEPCPWCGHAESLEIVDMGQTFGTVHCNGCGCDGPVDDGRPTRAWNTRAKDHSIAVDDVRERVRTAIARELDRDTLSPFERLNNAADAAIEAIGDDVREKYEELIYAVSIKHPQEDRHETALRYIRQAEGGSTAIGSQSIEGERGC